MKTHNTCKAEGTTYTYLSAERTEGVGGAARHQGV